MDAAVRSTDGGVGRVGRFGIVGLFNTVIDFLILNLAHFRFGLGLIPANLISTSVAMVFSFLANRHLVFTGSTRSVWRQAGIFWLVTAFGVYGLQNGVIWLLQHPLGGVLTLGVRLVRDVGIRQLSRNFITTNIAKVVATVVSLIWNYLVYREVVFV